MSRRTVSFVMLVIGSVLMWFFLPPATRAQSAAAPEVPVIDATVPQVPPLPTLAMKKALFRGMVQALDGLNCEGCTFENVTLEYAGGPYRLVGCTFQGTTRVVFKAAAMNVVTVLALMNEMAASQPSSGPNVTLPPRAFVNETPVKADWISPTSND